ncbi:MAG: AAA family ATPase [Acidiferrobacter thiooxydans]
MGKIVARMARRNTGYGRWPALEARIRLWLLRGLLESESWRPLYLGDAGEGYEDTEAFQMRRLLGLEALARNASRRTVLAAMRAALRATEAAEIDGLPGVQTLSAEIHLSAIEQEVLLFAALAKAAGLFRQGLQYMGKVRNRAEATALTAVCVGITSQEATAVLARGSVLAAVGLVTVEAQGYGSNLDDWLETAPDLLGHLLDPDLSAATLLASYLKTASEPARSLADFNHLAHVIALARPLLKSAAAGRRGVNVLFYGPPGTGKTALARALAVDLGMRLLEVAVTDADGDVLAPQGRARALRLVAHLAAHGQQAIVLFDEVEDYFREKYAFPGMVDRVGLGKGFSIDLLEQVASPVVWIGNKIDDIDPALLRRFSLACEIPPPPTPVRARLAAEYLTPLGLADHPLTERIARHEGLVPGLLAQAARTTALAAIGDCEARATYYAQVLNGLLAALGQAALPGREAAILGYDEAFVNADCDLMALIDGIGRLGCARILCVGAPGTGKSAWARHLAEVLGRPLLTYRASDLLDPYLGMSERHMAEMFARARAQSSVLLLDECDSFLRSRVGARHHWEVTQVNEMLTQMERFEGIFVATTNAREDIDEAAFRRFDRIVTFRPLVRDQRLALVTRILADQGMAVGLSLPETRLLDQCEGLTVGDVAAVLQGLRLEETWAAAGLVKAIYAAWRGRGRTDRRGMGFTAAMS